MMVFRHKNQSKLVKLQAESSIMNAQPHVQRKYKPIDGFRYYFFLSLPVRHVCEIPFRRRFYFEIDWGCSLWLRGQLDFSCEMSWIIKFGEKALDLISWIRIDFLPKFSWRHIKNQNWIHIRLQVTMKWKFPIFHALFHSMWDFSYLFFFM